MRLPFRERREAGRVLATKLSAYRDRPDVLVLALPRGGVPVAFEVARELHASRRASSRSWSGVNAPIGMTAPYRMCAAGP
jgi:hypothetical protein